MSIQVMIDIRQSQLRQIVNKKHEILLGRQRIPPAKFIESEERKKQNESSEKLRFSGYSARDKVRPFQDELLHV